MREQKKRFMQSERDNAIILLIMQTCPCNEHPLTRQRTFKKKNWGLQGYYYASYFCFKTKIVGTR